MRRADKPAFRVPTMGELRTIPDTGLRVVSTFSGCGGSCLGFRMAGYRVLYASEFVPAARETYAANFPDVPIDDRDIRDVKPEDILARAGVREGEVDVLEGSPPCASFSTSGNVEEDWGKVKKYSDVEQRTDDLFFEYVRILRGVRPRAFVAENVSGLVKGTARGMFREVLSAFMASGYRVSAKLLDAQWLGVPQARQRIIFVGVREDLGKDPPFPRPLPYRYSIRDAVPGVQSVRYDTSGIYQVSDHGEDDPIRTITVSGGAASYHFKVRGKRRKPEVEGDGAKFPDGETRKFYLAEVRRLCSFPDDFKLTGTYPQRWERLGRAVPPFMMRSVARALVPVLTAAR